MNWPALRFEKFFESMQKRKLVDELKQRKFAMLNAMYSNSNYDGENSKLREQAIENLEAQFANATTIIYTGKSPDEEQIDADNPFFKAVDRGLERQGVPTLEQMEKVEVSGGSDWQPEIEIDQN